MNLQIDMDKVVDDLVAESQVDYVGLWEIPQILRHVAPLAPSDEIRRLSLEVVKRLYEKGLRPGNYWGGDFDHWPDNGYQPAVDRIEAAWIKAGADPNLAYPICWFSNGAD